MQRTRSRRPSGNDETVGALCRLTGNGGWYMDGTKRSDIKPGLKVKIVLKKDQQTGKLTEGVVRDILTKSPTHPHGIKVRLQSGDIGRVKEIYPA